MKYIKKKKREKKTYRKSKTAKILFKSLILIFRKQLAAAAEVGTVESRIKANMNNIQRSRRAMDTNFAKR